MKIIESDFQAWMGEIQARMETALARLLPAAHIAPARLHEAMRYAALEGGKRVRPLLAFAAGGVADAAPARLEIVRASVDLIHAYSLVHDDLPCMGIDVLRCGPSTATLSTTAGKDSSQARRTYASGLGVARAPELADELRAESLAALEGFGSRARRLAERAECIVLR